MKPLGLSPGAESVAVAAWTVVGGVEAAGAAGWGSPGTSGRRSSGHQEPHSHLMVAKKKSLWIFILLISFLQKMAD